MSKMSLKSMNFSTTNPIQSRELLPFAEAVRESRRAKGHTASSDDVLQHVLVVLTLDDKGNVIDLDAPIVSRMMPPLASSRSQHRKRSTAVPAATEAVEGEHDENAH